MARIVIMGEQPFRIPQAARMNVACACGYTLQSSLRFKWSDSGRPISSDAEAEWKDYSDTIPANEQHFVDVYGDTTFRLHGNTAAAVINY